MLDLTVIVLTKDEKKHIARCMACVCQFASKVYVIDCFSTDGTQEIARSYGAEVVEHEWPGNQAAQFNWALSNLSITSLLMIFPNARPSDDQGLSLILDTSKNVERIATTIAQ